MSERYIGTTHDLEVYKLYELHGEQYFITLFSNQWIFLRNKVGQTVTELPSEFFDYIGSGDEPSWSDLIEDSKPDNLIDRILEAREAGCIDQFWRVILAGYCGF